MDPITLGISIVSLIGSGLVWWSKSGPTKKATGFAALLKGIMELIDKLDDEDDVKASLATDVLKAVKDHAAPATATQDVRQMIRDELRLLVNELGIATPKINGVSSQTGPA